jgi:hypothetical protein
MNEAPFIEVVAMCKSDAAEWVAPEPCHGIEYLRQADPKRNRFGARVYRVWTTKPTPLLRKQWRAA